MAGLSSSFWRYIQTWKSILTLAGLAVLIVVLLLYLAGRFAPKVGAPASSGPPTTSSAQVVVVRQVELPVTEYAVGTVKAVREARLVSKITAKVLAIKIIAGQKVKKDDLLIQLDDRDLKARLQQAEASLRSSEVQLSQAQTDEKRYGELRKVGSASQQEYDKAVTARKTLQEEVLRLQQAIDEARALLEYASIRAPYDATVVDKLVNAGDIVTAGQPLLTLFDPTHMQLVASVRETLAHQLKVGQDIGVRLDILPHACAGQISEIVPESQAESRSFQVKVTGPCPPGVYSGMFGRLMIPTGKENVLLIPSSTVRKIGQIELVDVLQNGVAERRAIRTGRTFGEDVEVLSGLRADEQVVAARTEGARP